MTVTMPAVAVLIGAVVTVSCSRQQHAPRPAGTIAPGQKAASAGTRTVVIHVGNMMKSKSGAT